MTERSAALFVVGKDAVELIDTETWLPAFDRTVHGGLACLDRGDALRHEKRDQSHRRRLAAFRFRASDVQDRDCESRSHRAPTRT